MPQLTPYTLGFRGGMRLGRRGVSLEESGVSIPSDTLFAALVDAHAHLGGDPQAFVQPFAASPPKPPFLLTSAFPLAGGLRFYPMPVNLQGLFSPQLLKERRKQVQRIAYLSEGLLKLALQGGHLDDCLFPEKEDQQPQKAAALQHGRLWFLCEEGALLPKAMQRPEGRRHAWFGLSLWSSGRVPRVTVDRINSASTIYHAARVTFAEDCGLWFGVEWLQPEAALPGGATYRQAVERALRFLADEGLGGERSSGFGGFALKSGQPFDLGTPPQNSTPAYLLSRYHPRRDELPDALLGEGCAYRLNAVGGWLRTPQGAAQRRKRLYLLQEGSLVTLPHHPAGDVQDLRPDYPNPLGEVKHPVYRWGFACALAWKHAEQGR